MVRAVIFDRGGTLLRERTGEVVLREILHPIYPQLKPADYARAEEASRAYWRSNISSLPRGQRWNSDIRRACLKAAVESLHLQGDPDEALARLDEYWDAFRVEGLYAGVHPCLTALSAARVPMGVLAQTLRNSFEVRAELERIGISRHFHTVLSVEDLPWDKPDPRVFQAIAEKMEVPPSGCVFVGDDHDLDAVGSKEAGMVPVLVDRAGKKPFDDVQRVANLTQIPGWLTTLP